MKRKVYHDRPTDVQQPDVSIWNDSWKDNQDSISVVNDDDEIYLLIKDKLHKNGTILEAGCGNGRWVISLSERGINVLGLDFSKVGLNNIKESRPNAQLVAGDVRTLPFNDRYFDVILSWGVLEHLLEGPDIAIAEHLRCLSDTGYLMITIPRLSPSRLLNPLVLIRRILSGSNLARKLLKRKQKCFFQYEYTSSYFATKLSNGGFKIIRQIPVGSEFGILDDMKPFSNFALRFYSHLLRKARFRGLLNWYFGSFTFYECVIKCRNKF